MLWFKQKQKVLISDKNNDLAILKIVQEINPSCQVTILTSKIGGKNCHKDSNDIEKSINIDLSIKSSTTSCPIAGIIVSNIISNSEPSIFTGFDR